VGSIPRRCFAKADCRSRSGRRAKAWWTTGQLFALWRALQELTDDPAIGLKMPSRVPLEQHHPASIAAQHARTFRDALQRLARYKILCCAEEMRLVEEKKECRLEFNWILTRELAPPLLIDAAFASSLELGRRGTRQPLRALRVELARNEDHREIHEAHYGCPVKFKARRNAIFFHTTDLDLPFVTYNAELLAMLSPQLDRELARRKAEQTLAAQVKWVLVRLLGGHQPEILAVAKELGMSCRTLQRRITEEGTKLPPTRQRRTSRTGQALPASAFAPARRNRLPPRLRRSQFFFPRLPRMGGHDAGEWKAAHRSRKATPSRR